MNSTNEFNLFVEPDAPIEVNLIVTCYDKEEYLFGFLECIKEYKYIIPNVCLCYNGTLHGFPSDIKLTNQGHQLGDISLTLAGYACLKNNGVSRFLKLGIDSWLMDDSIIYKIFRSMSQSKSAYAGNYWFAENTPSLSTDIIFADLNFGNIFEKFEWDGRFFETSLYTTILKNKLKISFIQERIPVEPENRFECSSLKWTMEHDLKKNLINFWKYKER